MVMQIKDKPGLIIVAGPTATGKSGLAVELALKNGGEVVSADSVQVYRGMDIGSAKITRDEMRGVPHHLIDVMDIDEEYNAVLFQSMAKKAIGEIYGRGHIPIICGGTGFYIQALLYDIEFEEDVRGEGAAVRRQLEELKCEQGDDFLRGLLKEEDPYTYETLDTVNIKKVVRALEFYRMHGYSFRRHNEEQAARRLMGISPYDYRFFVLNRERQELYRRIDSRVGTMIEDGLVDEVIGLKARGLRRGSTAGQAIGYKEIMAYLDGECTLEESVSRIRLNTRHFAKRQLTWFRREKNAIWIDTDKGNVTDEAGKYLQGFWSM